MEHLMSNILGRESYFWIANAMDHRIFVEVKPNSEIPTIQVTDDSSLDIKTNAKAPKDLCDLGGSVDYKNSKKAKYDTREHNVLSFEVCCMTAKRIPHKKDKMVYIYKGNLKENGSTTKGDLILSWEPNKGNVMLIKNSGDWYDQTTLKRDSKQKDAFEFKDPEGNIKSAFDSNKYKDGFSNDTNKVTFYVANALERPIFVKVDANKIIHIEREDTKMIETSKNKTIQLFEEKTEESANTRKRKYIADKTNFICRRFPENFHSLIVKKDGYVTESQEIIEDENDDNAWIDVKGINHAPINNESDDN